MTISENTRTQARLLVTVKHPNEESVRMRLGSLLESLGYDIELEYTDSDGGRMDIFLPQRRVVFETKRTGGADPEAVRDPDTGETQFEQCASAMYWRSGDVRGRGSTSTNWATCRGGRSLPMAGSGGCGIGRFCRTVT